MTKDCFSLFAITSGPFEGNTFFIVGVALLLGSILQIISHRIHIPVIVALLLGGIFVGPEGLNIIDPSKIDQELLKFIVSLAVAIILFEGGLGLDIEGFRQSPAVIRRLLSVGVVITWLGTAWAIYHLFGFSLNMSLLAGSLVIVTGPTVIQPILRRTLVKEKLHHILLWESVLIDPIGVFVAILSLEWALLSGDGSMAQVVVDFGSRIFLGLIFGVVGGLSLDWLLRNNRIGVEHVNITVLGGAIFLFGISDLILPESGLLTVTVAGFLIGYRNPPRLKQVSQFKQELTELSIGVLFILLAANLKLEQFINFLDIRGITLLVILLLVIRPLVIFTCTIGRNLSISEKIFLSWVSPRGIVAASITTLFALSLQARNRFDEADFILSFVFSVIGVSVVLQGMTTGIMAHLTQVKAPKRTGWVIIGAHRLCREIAHFLKDVVKVNVFLIDTNSQAVKEAQAEKLNAEVANATEKAIFERDIVVDVGNVLALTNNSHLNKAVCQTWSEIIPPENLWRWTPGHDDRDETQDNEGHPIWTDINNPVMLSWELESNQARLLWSIPESKENHEQVKILITPKKDQSITFSAPTDDTTNCLVLHRLSLNLFHLVRSEIIRRYEPASREELLKSMIEDLAQLHPEVIKDEMYKGLLEREQTFPTTIGNGVAIPHIYCETLKESVCAIGQIPKGVDFHAHDKQPIHLVFLLASPPGGPEHHLKILAEIASLASDSQMVESLVSAPKASDVLNLLENVGLKLNE